MSLRKIELSALLIVALMGLFAWVFYGPRQAMSVVAGGGIAMASFLWLKRDIRGIFGGPLGAARVMFFIKYYARLGLMAAVLYLLVRYRLVEIFGLLAGLSAVVTAIVITGISEARKMSIRVKEAV